jgi:hypothetical protein
MMGRMEKHREYLKANGFVRLQLMVHKDDAEQVKSQVKQMEENKLKEIENGKSQ